MSTYVFATSRLPSVSRVVSRKAPLSRTNLMFSTKNVMALTASFQNSCAIGKNASKRSVRRTFSTQFREDYDEWYSHGCTGNQTQSHEGILFYRDKGDDYSHYPRDMVVTYGVQQPISELPAVEDIDYNLEDQYIDYSDEEFGSSLFSSGIETIVSPEMMEYHPENNNDDYNVSKGDR